MGEKFKNVVCDPKDFFQDQKRQLFELINLNKTVCNNLPDLSIPNLKPNVPNLNPSQKIIDLLVDLLALVSGINFDEMRMQIINWLVEKLTPLSKNLSITLIESIKKCYACKIEPNIPNWMFQTDPITGLNGVGFNVELNKIDLTCLFATNPNSDVGKLMYDGNSTNDINTFMWDVIQKNGAPLIWSDPTNGKQIFEVRYYENSPISFTQNDGTVDYQNIEPRPRVFNFRVINSTYLNSSMTTLLVDYFNSQQPLFDSDKTIPNVVDLLYGTLTNKVKLPDECLTKVVELEKSIDDYIDNGIDNSEIIFDESFYTFDSKQLSDIKQKVKEKKSNVKKYKNCCGNETSSIPFDVLKDINDEIKNSSNLQQKINVYNKSLDKLILKSSENVKNLEKDSASAEFLSNFITSLQIVITKMVLSPKNLVMVNNFYYLVNSKPVTEVSTKKILKEYECILRDIIGEIIRKLIYEFLLPLIIRKLKNLVICVITKKFKEKQIFSLKSKLSLLPGFVNVDLEKINGLLGKTQGVVDKARGFSDKINLDSLNNVKSQLNRKNRFCD